MRAPPLRALWIIAWQLEQAMEQQKMSKSKMAKAMHTNRSQLDRILDPNFEKVQLNTLINAARVLGRELLIELVSSVKMKAGCVEGNSVKSLI